MPGNIFGYTFVWYPCVIKKMCNKKVSMPGTEIP